MNLMAGNKSSNATRSDSLRVLKSQDDARHMPAQPDFRQMNPAYQSHVPFDSRYLNAPVAFLDLTLKVVRTNGAFSNLAQHTDTIGKDLTDFVDPLDHRILQDLQRKLREERNAAEPIYLPPLYGGTDAIPAVEATNVDFVTQQYQDRPANLTFRINGQIFNLNVNFRLAKTDIFFVTLVLPSLEPVQPVYSFAQQQQQHQRQSLAASYSYAQPRMTMVNAPYAMGQNPPSPYYTFGSSGLISPLPTGTGAMLNQQGSYFIPSTVHAAQQPQAMYHFGAPPNAGMNPAEPRQQPRTNANLVGQVQQQQQQQMQQVQAQAQVQASTGGNLQLPPLSFGESGAQQQQRNSIDGGDEFRPDKRRRLDVKEMLA